MPETPVTPGAALASSNQPGSVADLTAVWLRCHAHLRPGAAHAPLAPGQHQRCGLCGGQRAFQVVAHLRYGADIWKHEQLVTYCPDCGRYSLDGPATSAGQPITAVNARLWSSRPTFLNIEPTTRCNFSCWYCIGRHMEQADIEVADFARMLDNYPSVKAIALVGEGEPLLHKGFFEMAHMARDRGVRVLMLSNGSAFSESVVRKICEAGIAYISVSIDSIDAATFAASRIDGDLPRIWEGIERLRRYRDDHGYRYPRISLKGTLFSHTEDELVAIATEARRRGVDLFESFQPLNPKQSYVKIYPPEQLPQLAAVPAVSAKIRRHSEAARAILRSAEDFCAEEGIPASGLGRPNGLRPNCDEEWLYALLGGQVTPCCQVKDVLDPRWNLFERPVDEILADAAYENMRFNLWNGLFPPYCEGCWKTGSAA